MSKASIGVLLVGDQPECLRLLRQQQFEVVCADRLANVLAQLKTSSVNVVLVALSLPDAQGTEAFVKLHEAVPHLPMIVLATRAEEKLAASLMPLGVQDYLLVPALTGPVLAKAIRNAIERHLIREEHSRAGHLLEVLMDNIPDSIYFKDRASRFVMINRAQAKKFGLADPHQATGKSDADFFKPAHAQQALADEQRVMQTGQPLVGIEEKETWPDGRETWVSTTKMPLRDRAGRVFGTFGISRDITEHRRTEQTLAERTVELSKERLLLRTLIDNLPHAIYAKDAAGRKTMANPADLKNLRCKTEADAIGKSDFDLFPEEVAKKFYDDDQKVIHGEPVINREEHFFDEAGRKRWLLTSKLPLRDQDGKIVGLVGIGHDITERKQAEETLDRERRLLRTLIDNLPDAIYAKDTAGRKTLANLADLKNLHFKTEAETIGKTDFDLFPRELAEKLNADDQKVIRGEPVINRDEYFLDDQGREHWLLTSKLPLRDQNGTITGLVGINRDITARKQAEVKLAYEQELFQTLLETVPDNIYFKDRKSHFVRVNRSKVEDTLQIVRDNYRTAQPNAGSEQWPSHLAGVKPFAEWLIGKTDFDTFPEAHARAAYEDEQEIIRTGKSIVGKLEKATLSDGNAIWRLSTKMPWRDKDGNIIGTLGISKDVTAIEEAEEALARERLLLRTVIDNLPDAIYAKDAAGRKTMANPADLKNLRCKTEADAIGKSDFDLFPPEVAQKFFDDDQKVLHGEPVINREEHFFDEAGRKRWLLTSKLPLRDQDGQIIGLVGIGHDITKRKEVELALAERTQELEQKHKQTAEELKMARELQLAMLPHEFPCVPRHKPRAESDLEFFSFFFPAGAVSGDFFDVIPLSDTTVGLFICDVMGHDVRAALVTAMMRALVVDLSATATEPGELLAQINREVAGVFNQTGSTMYATAFYLIADVARAELRYASAAHPEPILLHRQQSTVEWLGHGPGQKKGPALGLFAEGQFPTYRCPMKVGDLIALFTDGLIEAEGPDNESFSPERLLEAVRQRAKLPTNELFTGLLDEIKRFSTHSEFEDDVCIVGVEVKRLEAKQPN
jgi:sigma-B regulation protein RsbU (phosphoserine phosphatase)